MKRTVSEMAREFRQHWRNYVLQSALATLILLLALVLLRLEQMVIAASIGSTAFIVFAMPGALTAKARNVVGGQLVGVLSGAGCGALAGLTRFPFSVGLYALAVGLSIFIMVVTDTEHPPASGTALGLAVAEGAWGRTLEGSLAVMVGAGLLAIAHRLLRPYLRDLA
ncbi:MAG: HPP family protein [Planctomycetota bacterium]